MKIALSVVSTLSQRNQTLSVAESVTGGGISSAITEIEGASHVFLGAVIAYSKSSKLRDLDIPKKLIDDFGVYSEETAIAMARGVKKRFQSDWAVATTGVAGPGDSDGVKAGSIWVGFVGPESEETLLLEISGSRQQVRAGAVASLFPAFERILGRTGS
jgi:nicotinamide-nucleotide amidase